jgi:uncharacterized protein (TIGR03437 family)
MRHACAFALFLMQCSAIASGQRRAPADTVPATGTPTLSITAINLNANSLTWDPVNQVIYLSLPSLDGANGNAVQVLDPVSGQLGANVFAGSEPDLMSVSATSKFLYVSLDGASMIQRLTLPVLGKDIQIALGASTLNGAYVAGDVQASPVADGTVAVVRNNPDVDPEEEGGVVIYDNDMARPNVLCGFIEIGCNSGGELFDSIQWNATATEMFAVNNEDTAFDFYTVPVSAAGFGMLTDYPGLAGGFGYAIHFDKVTGYVYDDNGAILDPGTGTLVGTFAVSGLMVPDGALGKAFFLPQAVAGAGTGMLTLASFDLQRFTPIATAMLSNIVGSPTHLIRWGSNGLAFTTTNQGSGGQVYILSGSFVSSGGTLPAINTGGVTPASSPANTIQPGEWISIYGTNFATSTATWDGNFTTMLGGVSVTIDGRDAYLSYVSPNQINAQAPDDTAAGPVPVVVTTPAGVATGSVTLAEFGPSFLLLDDRHVAGVILRSDGSGAYGGGTYDILGPTGTSLGYATVAAKAGDLVELFAVGLGPTNQTVAAGQPFSGADATTNAVSLLIDNTSVPPSFSGLSAAGLYQINLMVPFGLANTGDVPLEATVGGVSTQAGVVMSLQ